MTTKRATWMLAALFAALCIAFTPAAEARRIDVWYDSTWQNIFTNPQEMASAIQAVLREWEQNSSDGVVLQWRGQPPPGAWPPANNSNILIYWDPNTDPRACAETCRFGGDLFCTVPPGRIRLYPFQDIVIVPSGEQLSGINLPTWVPGTPSACSLRATLMHQLGHILLDNGGHPNDSVLRSPINSLSGRHLWEGDRFLGASWFSRQQRGLAIEALDRSSQTVTSYGVSHTPESSLPSRIDTPVALSMGDGLGRVNNYAAAYGYRSASNPSSRGIQFLVGDGRTWSFSRQVACNDASCSNRAATSSRPCVVNAGGSALDYYLVWASSAQTLTGQGGQPGARAVMYAESHDRGATWTQPAAINGAFTRTGVTCSYDRYLNRVVVAYSGSGEDGVWLTDRAASAVGNVWRLPRMVAAGEGGNSLALASADAPYLAFDPFSNLPASLGILSWIDDRDLGVQVATVTYNASLGYVVSGAAMPVTAAQPGGFDLRERLRATPVVNFEGTPVVGLSMNPTYETNTQLRANLYGFFSSSAHVDSASSVFAPPSALQRYTGAASNRSVLETAFAVSTFIGPN